jgi:REP element-mobilizing transposase RayT
MKNHFHFLVRIKEENEIKVENLTGLPEPVRFNFIIPDRPSKQFSNLFNSYSKAFNKKYQRTGGLFERPFKRKWIKDESYMKILIYYIHHNPIHHGLVTRMEDYQWSSYNKIAMEEASGLSLGNVYDWLFCSKEHFLEFHEKDQNTDIIEE